MMLPFKIDIENLPCINRRNRIKTQVEHPILSGIYRITSPTGKVYIGLSVDIYNRIYQGYKIVRCQKQRILYHSLNKYSINSHIFEIIHILNTDNLSQLDISIELNRLETLYIKENNSFIDDNENGMNLTKGGDNSCKSNESIELIRIKNTGKKHSPESIEKMSGKNHHNYGKKLSPESIKKRTEKTSGENHYNYGKKMPDYVKNKLIEANTGKIPSKENRKKTSERFKGKKLTQEQKDKIGKSNKGKIVTEEARKKMSNAQKGKKHTEERKLKRVKVKQSPETIEKRVSKTRGENHWTKRKGHTKETKEKISKTLTGKYVGEKSPSFGKKRTPEQNKKNSEAKKGIKRSEESKNKQGDSIRGEKHHTFGKTISEDTRQKLRDSHLGNKPTEESKKKQGESMKATWAKKKSEGKTWRNKK